MFKTTPQNSQVNIDEIKSLLKPHYQLNKKLKEGEACWFKFTNKSRGVSAENIATLNALSNAIIDKQLVVKNPEDKLAVIDALVIFSNHLDQQKEVEDAFAQVEISRKQKLVYRWLDAAYSLATNNNESPIDKLVAHTDRALSSLAQLLFYYGKAMRYNQAPLETRLVLLEKALEIAVYLDDKKLDMDTDPHAYSARINTYELPIMYCLMDLNRFDDALEIARAQLTRIDEKQSPFHKIHAYCKVCEIYTKQAKQQNQAMNAEAFTMANAAIELSKATNVLPMIGERALMNAHFQAGNHSEATQLAQQIIDAPEGTVKDFVIAEAEKVIEACTKNTPTLV